MGSNSDASEAAAAALKAAVEAYQADELSVDEATARAGITKVEFLQRLGEFGVSVLRTDTIEEDAEVAREARDRTKKV